MFAEYDYKEQDKKVESRTRTTTGAEYVYKFGDFRQWKFKVSFVNSEVFSIVNSYWKSNADLKFVKTGLLGTTDVRITNKTKPIFGFNKPHDDLYHGMIELSTY